MKITDVHVDGFGVWSDLTIDELAPSITVFHGPNEAGKTTLMQFFRTVLYGYSPERRERYLPPVQGGKAGGGIGVVTLSGRFRVQRQAPDLERGERDDYGDAQLIAADGSIQRGAVLTNLLANIDEQVYTNVFAIGLRELQELATLNDTDAAQQLYKLTSGMDRVSLVDVMFSLEKARGQILSRDGRPAQLDQLLAERDRLRTELEQHVQLGRRWARLASERQDLEETAQQMEGHVWAAEQRSRIVEVAIQVRERWQRRRAAELQLEAIPVTHEIPAESLRKLDRIHRVLGEREKRLEALRQQRQRLRDEDKDIPWNAALWENRARLEAMTEHATWVESLRKHIDQLQAEIDRLTGELKQTCQELGLAPSSVSGSNNSRLDHRTMMSLRGPGRAVRDATRRLKQAQTESDSATQQVEELSTQLELELSERGHQHLASALERSGDVAEKMRRRIQVEERLEKLNRQKKELDDDCLELMQTPIMPLRQMIAWGSIVSFGVMLIMISFFSDMVGQHRVPVVFFGMMCTAGGFLLKHAYQQISTQELDECQRQLALVKKHIHQATTEREEVDAALPQGGGPLENRLKKAEEDLRKLEQLAPLEEQHALAQQRLEEAEKRLTQATAALKEARHRWRSALRKLNLAEDLTPQKIKHLADGHERISAIQRQLQAKRKEKEERTADLDALTQRIGDVLRESGLKPDSDDPRQQIRQMTDAIAEQSRARDRRASLRQQDRQLRRKGELCTRNMEKLRLRRQAMFSKVGADDEQEYRRMAADQTLRRKLEHERAELDQQIRLAVGAHCQVEDVEAELALNLDLQQRWQEAAQQVRELHNQRAQVHQKQGELQQEMKSLTADRRLDQTRLDLGRVEEQITRAKRRWRVLAVTGLALEAIRRVYESERQPETLNEASQFLQAFTDGRYRRIWTPLGKNSLRVDDADGKPLSVEFLSQGTREAVFLSLRLALVAAYARRGADLPLVLDDVLVNLDSQRADAAVKVLKEFAADGHQIMLFTCHEHIARMFENYQVDTRELPVNKSRGATISAKAVLVEEEAGDSPAEDTADELALALHVAEEPAEDDELSEPEAEVDGDESAEFEDESPAADVEAESEQEQTEDVEAEDVEAEDVEAEDEDVEAEEELRLAGEATEGEPPLDAAHKLLDELHSMADDALAEIRGPVEATSDEDFDLEVTPADHEDDQEPAAAELRDGEDEEREPRASMSDRPVSARTMTEPKRRQHKRSRGAKQRGAAAPRRRDERHPARWWDRE